MDGVVHGVIHITIKGGKDLASRDYLKESDPYV